MAAHAAGTGDSMAVIRLFVEKKPGFDVEAQHLKADLEENLGVTGLKEVRVVNRYDISGLSQQEFGAARGTIFSEPNADNVYDEEYPVPPGALVFAMEYLPGQYDQRADSAAQCVQLLTQGERPQVLSARVILLLGQLDEKMLDKVKQYLINPVESREASLNKPEALELQVEEPTSVARVQGMILWDDAKLTEYYHSMGFAMSLEDLFFCRNYFRDTEKRDPSITELRVIDTYWSDHCRHTTFATRLEKIEIEPGAPAIEQALCDYHAARKEVYGEKQKPICLMDIAVMGMKLLRQRGLLPDLDVSEEINACSIEVPVQIDGETQTWLVQFKNETHNHPTEIEPFGGAATCLGGAIRDPLSGRAYVYQAMRVTGSGDPRSTNTLPGKLPSRKITVGAAQGYSSYGNQVGLATGQVTELYDDGYVAKRMEIGAVIGASPKENVVREVPAAGDKIILLGGSTGRDGCGGATGSSKAHTQESVKVAGAEVQKGNAPTERKIQRLFRNPEAARLIKRCNDFGAGGVCVAIGELADGLQIHLDAVPKKYEGLDGTELAISESQERMAVVLSAKDVARFCALAEEENLQAVVVAEVTEQPRLCMEWRGDTIVDISREFLDTNGVTLSASASIPAPDLSENYRDLVPAELTEEPIAKAFEKNLSRLQVCSQKGLAERFDSSIGAATVLMPFAGKYQLSPEETMVAKLPVLNGETDDATAMSFGFIPGISRFSPFHGAAYAVVESLSKLAAVGADPLKARLTFQEYFERLRQEPRRWGKPAAALLGAFSAQMGLGLAAIGGKDSMSGSFEDLDVPPTLVSFAVAMTKASRTLSAAFQTPGSQVYLLPLPEQKETGLPDYPALREYYCAIRQMTEQGVIKAASVVREGGAAAAVARMCFGNGFGFRFAEGALDQKLLFAPQSGALVIEVVPGKTLARGLRSALLGTVTGEASVVLGSEVLGLKRLLAVWTGTLEKIFPTQTPEQAVANVPLYTQRFEKAPAIRAAKPRVFIPVFPGTNCEYDSAKAFARAGAEPEVLIVRNLTPAAIEETIVRMEQAIRSAQMIMLPGGFSGGDEPDGSGKFIATTFRNPRIAQAVEELLQQRDGLMLGVCNGFQALIKLGLVPFGHIVPTKESAPTLTFNTLGRHISRMAYTRVASVKSPWLAGVNAGDVFCVPMSHGEGRFVADEETLRRLAENGQIATQYTTPDGIPSGDSQWNPNGSVWAIEGITSPDGRVLGKMGHSERKGTDLYRNVPGEKDQRIFESGVAYFK